jgi:hypothetical protein
LFWEIGKTNGYSNMKHSIGNKQCEKCGSIFQTDLRGGAKWCFPCKAVVKREYQLRYRRPKKRREYAAG